jgi:hypothetical protein
MSCRRRRAPYASSASAASPPTFRSSRRCWRIPISRQPHQHRFHRHPCRRSRRRKREIARPLFFERGKLRASWPQPTNPCSRRPVRRARSGAGAVAGHHRRDRGREGDLVRPGQQIAVLESMKMEHLVTAPHGGKVTKLAAANRRDVDAGEAILFLEPAEIDAHDKAEQKCRSRSHPPRSWPN